MMHSFAKLVYAQVVLGVVAYGVAEQNAPMVLMAGTLSMLSWYIVEGPGGRPVPRWVINIGVLCVTVWLFYAQIKLNEPMLHSLGKFILFIQIFKLYERKTNRDYAQLIVLSLLLMVCAAIISAAIIFGILLVAYLVLALFSVLLYQIKISHDEVLESNIAAAGPGRQVPQPSPVASRGYSRQFRLLGVACGLGAVVISGMFFVIMPRGQGTGMLGDWQPATSNARSGFDSQVQLSGGMQITASPVPVMNIRLTRNGDDIGSPEYSFLLRGAVLDSYDPRRSRWYRSRDIQDHALLLKFDDTGTIELPNPAPPDALRQDITVRSPSRGFLFAAWAPVMMRSLDHPQIHFHPHDQAIQVRGTGGQSLDYTVWSVPDPSPAVLEGYEQLSAKVRIAVPPLAPDYALTPVVEQDAMARIRTLTERAMQQRGLQRDPTADTTPADDQIARALENYLQTEYRYTLTIPPVPQGSDPISAFLFETRRGHCEYFASALTTMLRSVGIRARVVNGYRAVEFNAVGGYYVVRQKNAHAWVEAWSPTGIWQAYDPSPPEIIDEIHRPAQGFFAMLRDIYEYLEYAWVTNVITFDATQRREVMANVDDGLSTARSRVGDVVKRAMQWLREFPRGWLLGTFGYTLVAVLVIVICIGLGLLAVIVIRRRRLVQQLQLQGLTGRQRRRLAGSLEFYLQMLDMLRKAGHEKPLWQTPAAFAQHLRHLDADSFGEVGPLTEIFYEIRYGERPLDTARYRRIQEHMERLRLGLAAHRPADESMPADAVPA